MWAHFRKQLLFHSYGCISLFLICVSFTVIVDFINIRYYGREGMATHSSILVILLWKEESGGRQSMGHEELGTTGVTEPACMHRYYGNESKANRQPLVIKKFSCTYLCSYHWCSLFPCIDSDSYLVSFSFSFKDFPISLTGSSDGKASTCNAGSIPGLGRSPGEENGNPLQYSCQENSMDEEA